MTRKNEKTETAVGDVWITDLPDGAISVWTPPNARASDHVTDLVRSYTAPKIGRWDGQHRNWIIFKPFAEEFEHALTR